MKKTKREEELQAKIDYLEGKIGSYEGMLDLYIKQKKEKYHKFWMNWSGAISFTFLVIAGIFLIVLSDMLFAIFCLVMATYLNINYWNYKREMKP